MHCVGLRNPYGIAFKADGEPFSYDADNEGDIGLPLYRPTRVNHLVSGGNYGWSCTDPKRAVILRRATTPYCLKIRMVSAWSSIMCRVKATSAPA